MQATNYCSGLNRAMKAKTQLWTVRAIYADAQLNVEYQYRTERGARAQVAYLERLIAHDAIRALGNEIAMVGVQISDRS